MKASQDNAGQPAAREEKSRLSSLGPGRRRRLALLLAVLVLAPSAWSYTTTMAKPSSLLLGVRTVEWVRAHHGAWLVDSAEHVWFGWVNAPSARGPAARAIPRLALPASSPAPQVPRTRDVLPANVPPVIAPALPGEGVWRPAGPDVGGGPPILVTEFRPDATYPRTFAYAAWFEKEQLPKASGSYVVGRANLEARYRAEELIDIPAASAEVGYWLDAGLEGRGLVTRAVTAVLDHAFGPLGLHRVELQTTTDNTRSRRVAERLGFTQEGVLREAAAFPGERRDVVVHGLLAREWHKPPV